MIKVYEQGTNLKNKLVRKFSTSEELEGFFREEGEKVWNAVQWTVRTFGASAMNALANKGIDSLAKAIERSRNYYTIRVA